MSEEHKKIAIVDLCHPSEVHQAQLLAAAMLKQQTCQPLVEDYTKQGWVVHVFPWVVGIRGMILFTRGFPPEVFDIQRKHWRVAVEQTALVSVKAFHFLHQVRFGGQPTMSYPDIRCRILTYDVAS